MQSKLRIGKISIDNYNTNAALYKIHQLLSDGTGGRVYTPNVDHIILAEKNVRFATAYARASMALPDGMPIVWASKLLKPKIYQRVAGSDFLMPLLSLAARRDYKVFFLGSTNTVMQKAMGLTNYFTPRLNIVGYSCPLVSDKVSETEVSDIMQEVIKHKPNIIIVALGAPKQEIFIDNAYKYSPQSVFIGLGASFDFITGQTQRAPAFLRHIGLEWLYRFYQEPKRLWKRYLRDLQFPLIVLRELLFRRKK